MRLATSDKVLALHDQVQRNRSRKGLFGRLRSSGRLEASVNATTHELSRLATETNVDGDESAISQIPLTMHDPKWRAHLSKPIQRTPIVSCEILRPFDERLEAG